MQTIHSHMLLFSVDVDRFRAPNPSLFHQRFQGLVELMSSSQTSPQTNKFKPTSILSCPVYWKVCIVWVNILCHISILGFPFWMKESTPLNQHNWPMITKKNINTSLLGSFVFGCWSFPKRNMTLFRSSRFLRSITSFRWKSSHRFASCPQIDKTQSISLKKTM